MIDICLHLFFFLIEARGVSFSRHLQQQQQQQQMDTV